MADGFMSMPTFTPSPSSDSAQLALPHKDNGALAFVETIRQRHWRWALCIVVGMALIASISLPDWFGAKLPSFARDFLFRSIAWYEKGHFEEALSDIDRSVALDPGDMTALHHRGNVLLALDRFEEARR